MKKKKTKSKPRTKRLPSVEERELAGQEHSPLIAFEEGIPQPEPFNDLARAYQVNPWAYAAVFAIASNLSALDFTFLKKKPDGSFVDFPNHPIGNLIENPNPYMTSYDLKEATFSFMELTGNAYWVLEDFGGNEPKELWPVPPHLMKPASEPGKFISHYIMDTGDGRRVRFEVDRVIQFKDFSPISMHYGQGSTLPARNAITVDLFQTIYNKTFFVNNARPDAILEVAEEMDPLVRRRMLNAWEAMHRGLKSAHRVALLEGGTTYKETNRSHKDMEYREGKKQNREEMLATYGVPPVVIGLTEGVNFATAKEQYKAFWNNTLLPKKRRFEATLTHRARQITLILDASANAETNNVEALNGNAKDAADTGKIYLEMGIPLNMVIDALELPFEHVEGGDEPRKPVAPIAAPVEDEPKDNKDDNDKNIEPINKSMGAEAKGAHWKRFINEVEDRESKMEFDMVRFFRAQRLRVLKALDKNANAIVPAKSLTDKVKTLFNHEKAETPEASIIVEVIFDADIEAEKMGASAKPHIKGAFGEFAISSSKLVDPAFNFNLADPIAEAWINAKTFKLVTHATKTTMEAIGKEVVEAIEEATAQGFTAGESIADIAKRIDGVYDFALKNRSKMIARTEVISASNAGGLEGMTQAGAELKEWLVADSSARDTHLGIDAMVVTISSAFPVGGSMLQFPGDPAGDAEEVINCRCTILPAFKEDQPK